MYTLPSNVCPICGKYKNRTSNHSACAKIMQAKHEKDNKHKRKAPKRHKKYANDGFAQYINSKDYT